MSLIPIKESSLPQSFVVTKHAFARAMGRHKKVFKKNHPEVYLREVVQNGAYVAKPFYTGGGVSYSKTDGKVTVHVKVNLNAEGVLDDVGFITTVTVRGGQYE